LECIILKFKLFTIPTIDDGSAIEEMNAFLRSHRVLEVEQQLVSGKTGSRWHFCVKNMKKSVSLQKFSGQGVNL